MCRLQSLNLLPAVLAKATNEAQSALLTLTVTGEQFSVMNVHLSPVTEPALLPILAETVLPAIGLAVTDILLF